MATMFPAIGPQPGDGPGKRTEGLLFEALKRGLPDDYRVYWNLKMLSGETARQSEADFLVVHPRYGFLVIECKGEGVARGSDGVWRRGGERIKDPVDQVRDQVGALTRKLKRAGPRLLTERNRFEHRVGHALAFPLETLVRPDDGETELLGLPSTLIFDSADLDNIEERVRQAIYFFTRVHSPVPPLTEEELEALHHGVLLPAFRLVRTLRTRLSEDARTLHALTHDQAEVLESLLDNSRLLITGGAGTGKTLIALEAARRLALEGKSVLLTCFTTKLCDHLRGVAGGFREELDGKGKLHITSYHRLCAHAGHLMKSWEPPDDESSGEFWREGATEKLLSAVDKKLIGPYDAIVVDEGQDFHEDWWAALELLLDSDSDSRLLIFADPSQALYGPEPSLPKGLPKFRLKKNLRNTQAIARFVEKLSPDAAARPNDRAPHGDAPVLERQKSPNRTLPKIQRIVDELIRRDGLHPESITLLSPHTKKNSVFREADELAGIPITEDLKEREGKLFHSSVGGFKGLESDVVILTDVDPADERSSPEAVYVGASRACHRLYVFHDEAWSVTASRKSSTQVQ